MYKLLTITIASELYDLLDMLVEGGFRVKYNVVFHDTGWVFPESPILYGIYVEEEMLVESAKKLDKYGWTMFAFKQNTNTIAMRRELRKKNTPLWKRSEEIPDNTELGRAIIHCYEVADEAGCGDCRDEHLQLAAWLEDYQKMLKEKSG